MSNHALSRSPMLRGVGILLTLPSLLLGLLTLLIPSIATINLSFQQYDMLTPPQFVGWKNYTQLWTNDPTFSSALSFTWNLVAWRVAAVAVVPLLLAWSLHYWGRKIRIGVRLLFSLPIALLAPIPILLSWKLALGAWLAKTDSMWLILSALDGLISFVIACGAGLILFGAVFRTPEEDRSSMWLGTLVCWFCFVLAAIALALQSMTSSLIVTSGGPGYSTLTIGLWHYLNAFQYFRFGYAATVSTLLLISIGALGIIATIAIIASNIGLTLAAEKEPADSARTAGGIVRIALLPLALIGLVLCIVSVVPLLQTLQQSDPEPVALEVSNLRLWMNTLTPALFSTAIQLTLSGLAAFGIGALRPFGRRSEWLLLLFSPWLFTTVLPLSQTFFEARRQLGLLNTLSGNIQPLLINVPILFLLTLFYKGHEQRYRKNLAEGRPRPLVFAVLLPSLPLVLFAGIALWIATMQDLYWPLLINNATENFTWPVMLRFQQANGVAGTASSIRAFQLPLIGITLLVLGVYHFFFLDRLAVTTSTELER